MLFAELMAMRHGRRAMAAWPLSLRSQPIRANYPYRTPRTFTVRGVVVFGAMALEVKKTAVVGRAVAEAWH